MSQEIDQETGEIIGGRYQLQFDIGYTGKPGKKMKTDTKTVPDMTLTVRQLMEHHTRGVESEYYRNPVYFETEIPTIRDLTDVQEYKERLENTIIKVQQFIDDELAEKAAAEQAEQERLARIADNENIDK